MFINFVNDTFFFPGKEGVLHLENEKHRKIRLLRKQHLLIIGIKAFQDNKLT